MILATLIGAATVGGGWLIGSATSWIAGEYEAQEEDAPPWYLMVIMGVVGLVCLMLAAGWTARLFGKATKEAGIVREVRKVAVKAGDVAEHGIDAVAKPVLSIVGTVIP